MLLSRIVVSSALMFMVMGTGMHPASAAEVPDKTVVLSFDDAVKSHVTVVAPLLQEFGCSATFFDTQRWMDDSRNFMSWEDQLHDKGFEIGSHSWTHEEFAS